MHRSGILLRAAAGGIDLLAAALLLGFARVAAGMNDAILPGERLHVARAGFCFLWVLYSSMEVTFGASLGKLALGLEILRQDGREAEFSRLLLRWSTKNYWLLPALVDYFYINGLLRIFAGLMIGLLLVGLLGAFNEDGLTWHDQWSGTAVCKQQRQPAPSRPRRVRRRVYEYH